MTKTKTKKDASWFSHDQYALFDTRMQLLFGDYGFAGYGRWWHVLEILRGEVDYKYDICQEFAYKILSRSLKMTIAKTTAFINDCVKYGLLVNDGTHLYSESLVERMEHMDKRAMSFSERGKKGAEVTHGKKLAKPEPSVGIAQAEPGLILANKTKQKETKQNDDEEESTKEENIIATAVLPLAEVDAITPDSTTATTNWDALQALAMADDANFVQPCMATYNLTRYLLGKSLTEFNQHLQLHMKPAKTIADYRAHFASWMACKFGTTTNIAANVGGTYNIGQKRLPRKHIRGR